MRRGRNLRHFHGEKASKVKEEGEAVEKVLVLLTVANPGNRPCSDLGGLLKMWERGFQGHIAGLACFLFFNGKTLLEMAPM